MKCFTVLSVVFVSLFCAVAFSFADELWEPVTGINEPDIREVVVMEGVVFAASEKRLYRSEDGGVTWEIVFSAKGDGNSINFISISEKAVFVCTEKGVYKSLDGKSKWRTIFKGVGPEENSILHIAFLEEGKIYIGTRGGLFVSNDNGVTWEKDSGGAGNLSVRWIAPKGKELFLATEYGVYKGSDSGWRRVFVTQREEAEYDSDLQDEAVSAVKPVNSIMVDKERIFLAADLGIFVSDDNGETWQSFTSDGLMSRKVKRLLFKDNVYAATEEGVFVFEEKGKKWRALYKGMAADKAQSITRANDGTIWVATNKGLYRSNGTSAVIARNVVTKQSQEEIASFLPVARNDKRNAEENILELFNHEPSIKEMQNVAIEYAEVHPGKIKEWRDRAQKKALLPDVSVGLDRYVTDYWHWDAGANPDVLVRGDDAISWDVTMSWKLGELVWNDDQTSIDTRSRLMVQLRDDILDEITRTYFERRRLQIESYISPLEDLRLKLERELRIQELTADLDALTGGYFSERVKP
ncbi:hypothetical protein KKC91_04265 [bacterium]|nr:hypothetical protein [bacterium]